LLIMSVHVICNKQAFVALFSIPANDDIVITFLKNILNNCVLPVIGKIAKTTDAYDQKLPAHCLA